MDLSHFQNKRLICLLPRGIRPIRVKRTVDDVFFADKQCKGYDWPECHGNGGFPSGKLAREDGDRMGKEGEEKKDAGGTKGRNAASGNERGVGSRGYVLLADYRSRLKHRLLLQQLEVRFSRLRDDGI